MPLYRLDADGTQDASADASRLQHALGVTWAAAFGVARRLGLHLPAFVDLDAHDGAALSALGVNVRPSPPPVVAAPADAGARLARVWLPLRELLVVTAPEALEALHPPALALDVAEAERRLGAPLPDDLLAFFALHDGQDDSRGPFAWRLMGVAEALERKAVRDALPHQDLTGEGDARVAPLYWHPRWWPLLENGAGDLVCLDLAPVPGGRCGQVIECFLDGPKREVLAPSFLAWLEGYAADVRAGRVVATEYADDEFAGMMRRDGLTDSLSGLRVRGEPEGERRERVEREIFANGLVLAGEALPRLCREFVGNERRELVDLAPAAASFGPPKIALLQALAGVLDGSGPARRAKAEALLRALLASPHVIAVRATVEDIEAIFDRIAAH